MTKEGGWVSRSKKSRKIKRREDLLSRGLVGKKRVDDHQSSETDDVISFN